MAVDPRPRRRLDPVRRPQILATAAELVREKGLWSVRISDVARRAGVSPANVVYYFGSKDELFVQAIASADDAFYAALEPQLTAVSDPVERLALMVVRSSESDWVLWVDLWVYARYHPAIAGVERHFSRRWRDAIADVLRHGEQTGAWGPLDADAVAQRLAALTDGIAVHMTLGEGDHTRATFVSMVLTAAALELGRDADDLEAAAARVPVMADAE